MQPPENTFTAPDQEDISLAGGDGSPVALRKDSEFGASPGMMSPQGPRQADVTSAVAVEVDAAKRSVTTPTPSKSTLWKARPQMQRTGFQAAPSGGGRLLAPSLEPVSRRLDLRSFDGRTWGRLRLLVDVIVLYLAACAAALGDSTVRSQPSTGWIAVSFPLVVLVMLYARRTPDTRLQASLLDTAMHVLGVVSLATMLIIGVASVFDVHPLQLALRLWLFAMVYLGLARAVMLSVRQSLTRSGALAVPTLIVGAGTVGTHLVMRLEEREEDEPGDLEQGELAPLFQAQAPRRLTSELPHHPLERPVKTPGERLATQHLHPARMRKEIRRAGGVGEREEGIGIARQHMVPIDQKHGNARARPGGRPRGDREARCATLRDHEKPQPLRRPHREPLCDRSHRIAERRRPIPLGEQETERTRTRHDADVAHRDLGQPQRRERRVIQRERWCGKTQRGGERPEQDGARGRREQPGSRRERMHATRVAAPLWQTGITGTPPESPLRKKEHPQ